MSKKEYKDYKGAIHIHSRYSDGSGSLQEIVDAGNDAKLDYMVITDHNMLRHKDEGAEGWHNQTLVLVGEEVSPKNNHYLSMGINKPINPKGMAAQEYIDEVNRQGGLGFIVHPDSQRKRTLPIGERPWHNWEVKNFTGLELWSYMYDWLGPVHLFNLVKYIPCPEKAIKGPPAAALQRWDELTQSRQVAIIGGVDAHARNIIPFGILKVFPYHQLFSTIRTHILTSPFQSSLDHDKDLVYSALRKGNSYISYDYLADGSGLKFGVINKDGEEAIMGDEIQFSSGLTLMAVAPRPATMRIIHNGRLVEEKDGVSLEKPLNEKGVYRLEVYLEGKSWMYTNPVYVR